jgi:acyl-CoA synthetase (AMP-forming)/AMP-acid ligase II
MHALSPPFTLHTPVLHAFMRSLPSYHIYGMLLCNISALARGVTIVSLPKFDAVPFLETLQRYKVTYAPLVPPIINFLARHPVVSHAAAADAHASLLPPSSPPSASRPSPSAGRQVRPLGAAHHLQRRGPPGRRDAGGGHAAPAKRLRTAGLRCAPASPVLCASAE